MHASLAFWGTIHDFKINIYFLFECFPSQQHQKLPMWKMVLIMYYGKILLNHTGSKKKKRWASLIKNGDSKWWLFDWHKQTQYKFYSKELQNFFIRASQKTDEDVPKPRRDECLQLGIRVRLEGREEKLISLAYESKAHFPLWKLICRTFGWHI